MAGSQSNDDGNDVYEYQVIGKTEETPDTNTYSLSPVSASHRFSFNIGHYVTLSVTLKRPTSSGKEEETIVERAYSIVSSPTRDILELTIKDEKTYGYINPVSRKADGFAAYFFKQIRLGDKIRLKPSKSKIHFLSKVADGIEKDIAYWSGANGAESARCLIQYMEDMKDPELKLVLFYSNPRIYISDDGSENNKKTINVIYYNWLLELAKKLENFKVIFTFTKEKEIPLTSDHPRIVYRTGRFFKDPDGNTERTLLKYHGNVESAFNPICGSSALINGIAKLNTGEIVRGRGIMQDLLEIEGVKPQKIDKEQYYLQVLGV
ncbi:MAG: FAD-binding oxidoreductase [Nitrososphaeraceae archaeon]